MLRRRAIIDGDPNWRSITESSVRKIGWKDGDGLRWDFTYNGMNVYSPEVFDTNLATKKGQILDLLNNHPEGIVFYNTSKPHAVLLTDYDSSTGTYYCADPALGTGRIKLTSSTLPGGTQDGIIGNVRQYWYIKNRSGGGNVKPGKPTITGGAGSYMQSNTVTLNISASGATTYWCDLKKWDDSKKDYTISIANKETKNGVFSISGLSAGGYRFYASASNSAGYTDSDPVYFTVYSTSANIANGYYVIQHKTSKKYVSAGSSTADATKAILYEDGNGPDPGLAQDQQFYFERQNDGTYIFTARHSNKAMEVYNLDLNNGARIIQWPKSGSDQQKWYIIDTGNGYYKFLSKFSGKCLDINGNGTANSTAVQQYTDNGSDGQRFALIRQDFTVTYNANGGTGAPAPQIKWRDVTLALSTQKPTRAGYTFLGWASSSTATAAQAQPGINVVGNTNAAFYAVWKSNVTYTLTYDANGGTGAPGPQSIREGTPITLSTVRPTRSGYAFQGWSIIKGSSTASCQPGGTVSINPVCDVTFYAVWKAMTYTVSYSANGGSGVPAAQTKQHGANLVLSSVKPTRSGYTFQGWATSSTAATAQYQPGGSYTANASVTLYAVWKASATTYTITYNANGGTGAPSSQVKTQGVTLTLSSTKPTRSGYLFLGWATSSNAATATYSAGASYATNASVTLYAVWIANTYVVKENGESMGVRIRSGSASSYSTTGGLGYGSRFTISQAIISGSVTWGKIAAVQTKTNGTWGTQVGQWVVLNNCDKAV